MRCRRRSTIQYTATPPNPPTITQKDASSGSVRSTPAEGAHPSPQHRRAARPGQPSAMQLG